MWTQEIVFEVLRRNWVKTKLWEIKLIFFVEQSVFPGGGGCNNFLHTYHVIKLNFQTFGKISRKLNFLERKLIITQKRKFMLHNFAFTHFFVGRLDCSEDGPSMSKNVKKFKFTLQNTSESPYRSETIFKKFQNTRLCI